MTHHSTRLRHGAALLLATLLVVLMATSAAADHLTAPTIGVSQNSTAMLTRGKPVTVTVSGTVTCEQDAEVYVSVRVEQPKGRGLLKGSGETWITCDAEVGSAPWVVTVTETYKGSFSKGAASMRTTAQSWVGEDSAECEINTSWCGYYYDDSDNIRYYHYAAFTAQSTGSITIS